MATGDVAGERPNHLVAVEIARDMAHGAVGVEVGPVPAGDTGSFLPAMLERVEPQRDHCRGSVSAMNTEDAALLAQLVVVKRVRRQHVRSAHLHRLGWEVRSASGPHIGGDGALVCPAMSCDCHKSSHVAFRVRFVGAGASERPLA